MDLQYLNLCGKQQHQLQTMEKNPPTTIDSGNLVLELLVFTTEN